MTASRVLAKRSNQRGERRAERQSDPLPARPSIAFRAEFIVFRARGTVPEHGREGAVSISARV